VDVGRGKHAENRPEIELAFRPDVEEAGAES
jgi:hypothetical protein